MQAPLYLLRRIEQHAATALPHIVAKRHVWMRQRRLGGDRRMRQQAGPKIRRAAPLIFRVGSADAAEEMRVAASYLRQTPALVQTL